MNTTLDIKWAYQLLQADHSACEDSIKQNYRKLVKQWHPDRWARYPDKRAHAARKMQQINDAYRMIRTAPLRHQPQQTQQPQSAHNDAWSQTYREYSTTRRSSHHESRHPPRPAYRRRRRGGSPLTFLFYHTFLFIAGYILGMGITHILIPAFLDIPFADLSPALVYGVQFTFGGLSMIFKDGFWGFLIELIFIWF
ncbi:MAG: J domain-containing protein [Rhodospirillales bacterium]|nr:J domain-containing protein [Rhodospirillales bacterium]MCB9995892.1 J domain-containing protein [Rhodospirillales bacterium]